MMPLEEALVEVDYAASPTSLPLFVKHRDKWNTTDSELQLRTGRILSRDNFVSW